MFPNVTIPTPTDFFFPRWHSNPLFRGSYSNMPAAYVPAHQDNLRATVDERLWFAGEASSKKYYGMYLAFLVPSSHLFIYYPVNRILAWRLLRGIECDEQTGGLHWCRRMFRSPSCWEHQTVTSCYLYNKVLAFTSSNMGVVFCGYIIRMFYITRYFSIQIDDERSALLPVVKHFYQVCIWVESYLWHVSLMSLEYTFHVRNFDLFILVWTSRMISQTFLLGPPRSRP